MAKSVHSTARAAGAYGASHGASTAPPPYEPGGFRQDGTPSDKQRAASSLDELNTPEVSQRVVKLALKQLDRLVSLEPKVLRGESTEAVHNLRVASRRLQGLIDYLYPAPSRNGIRKLRRRLKQARQALGDLRNQDVMAWRIERVLARKRVARRGAWVAAQDYVGKLRPKAAQRAHRKLTRLNLPDFYLRLREELQQRRPAGPAEATRVIAFPDERAAAEYIAAADAGPDGAGSDGANAAGRFSERLAELWRDFTAKAASHKDVASLHALRIAAKRLRYLLEVAADLEVTGSSEALAWLRDLQGRLGDWHDCQVLGSTLLEMVARRDFLEQNLKLAIEVEKLVLALRSSKTRSCEHYLEVTFKSAEYRRTAQWLAQWAARRPLPTA
jgi:CHAD domain-containing protein